MRRKWICKKLGKLRGERCRIKLFLKLKCTAESQKTVKRPTKETKRCSAYKKETLSAAKTNWAFRIRFTVSDRHSLAEINPKKQEHK